MKKNNNNKENNKEEEYKPEPIGLRYAWELFKKLVPNILLWFGIMVAIVLLRMQIWQVILFLWGVQWIVALYIYIRTKQFSLKKTLKGMGQTALILGIIWIFYKTIGVKYAVFSYIFFIFAFAVYRIIYHRKMYIKVMRDIESHIWGKPLEKKFWSEEELREWKTRKNS